MTEALIGTCILAITTVIFVNLNYLKILKCIKKRTIIIL